MAAGSSGYMDGEKVEYLQIVIDGEGRSTVHFFPPSFSEFIVKNIIPDEEREKFEDFQRRYGTGNRNIYCG